MAALALSFQLLPTAALKVAHVVTFRPVMLWMLCRLQGMEPEIQRLMAKHKAEMATAAEQAAQSTRSVQITVTYS